MYLLRLNNAVSTVPKIQIIIPLYCNDIVSKVEFYINYILGYKFTLTSNSFYIDYLHVNFNTEDDKIMNYKLQSLKEQQLYIFLSTLNIKNFIQIGQGQGSSYKHKFDKFVKILYSTVELEDIKHLLIYSGACLYILGTTFTKDIDILILGLDFESAHKKYNKLLELPFIDVCIYCNNNYYDLNNNLHHNADNLKHLNLNTKYLNYNGINFCTVNMVQEFYYSRIFNKLSKGYLLYDIYMLNRQNNINFLHHTRPSNVSQFSLEDIEKLQFFIKKYLKENVTLSFLKNLLPQIL